MAYLNGFPATYPQYYPQFQQSQPGNVQNNAQIQQNGIIWVQGEAGAKSYLVAPNTTVQLWDSESQRIFLKSADASGMPSMKVLEYTVKDGNSPISPVSDADNNSIKYATKDDVEAVSSQIEALRKRFEKLSRQMKEDDE